MGILLAWQFWPVYLCIAAAFCIPSRFRKTRLAVVGLLGAVSLAAWLTLPAPWLERPGGPFRVGTMTYRWVDQSRPELSTDDPSDRRNVIVQAFYPAPQTAAGRSSVYIDGLGRLPPFVSGLPRLFLRSFGEAETNSIVNAPLAADRERWPVIVFSPGYGAPRSFYTSLITELASRGIVVLAIDHPYEAGVVELSDGRVVSTLVRQRANDPNLLEYMASQQSLRVSDIRFALDQIAREALASKLDLAHSAAIGHSFGGASSMAALGEDSRLIAAVNIDGTPYGSLPERRLDRPVMLLTSDPAWTKGSEAYRKGNRRILVNLSGAQGYHYTLRDSNHFMFTDLPLFFSPPGRWLLSRLKGSGMGCMDCIRPRDLYVATADLLTAFLYDRASLDRIAQRYNWVAGGPVH